MKMKEKFPYPSLDTPAVLINMDKLEANIREISRQAREAGVRLRVHVKSHASVEIAKLQIKAGSCGIEVGPIKQAEAMAEEGIDDIIIAHPGFYGSHKLETLKRLLSKSWLKIAIVVDMKEQVEGISHAGREVNRTVPIILKIDLGRNSRYGISPGEEVLNFAKKIHKLPYIDFMGIYAHEMGSEPTEESVSKVAYEALSTMAETAKMLRKNGIKIEHVSLGSSATFRSTCCYLKKKNFPEITEIHPGGGVIGDIMYMKGLGVKRENCAVTVLTTVMSTSHSNWAVIDAGYKTFGADSIIGHRKDPDFFWKGKPSFGSIQDRPDLWLGRLSAETACVYYKDLKKKLQLGERLEIVPNNATLLINIHEKIYGVRNNIVERIITITGRGQGN